MSKYSTFDDSKYIWMKNIVSDSGDLDEAHGCWSAQTETHQLQIICRE